MAASISEQLADLLNPLPNFADPEDDQDDETKARVVDKFDEGGDAEDLPVSGLRKRASALLVDSDKRYHGKVTSRKELQQDFDGSDDDDDSNDEDIDEEEDEKEDDLSDGDEGSQVSSLVTRMKGADLSFSKNTDFRKLTEGMDDLGESDDEDEDEDEDEATSSEDEEEEDDDEGGDSGGVMTFSKEKVNEEVDKGKAVKNQLALWDLILEGRIKMQKALMTANQLPQPDTFPEFKSKGGAEYTGALKNSHKALKALQRSLLELQDLLLYQNPETRAIAQGKTRGPDSSKSEDDEEIDSDEGENEEDVEDEPVSRETSKRKLETAHYPDFMAKRFAAFQPYRDATLQKWYDKTRLTTGKTNKGFGAFERNILTQVEQVLMDKERLLKRTQTRRSDDRVLGRAELSSVTTQSSSTEPEAPALKANAHLKDLDEEIFDDDDFYHQLLRELIERKTSATDPNDQVAMGRQWLAIQKLRSKIKKKVDTKASKGRKVRFHLHSKLMNFMAPIDHSTMSDEARSELYRSLFGSQMLQ
ncbi:protein AATF isoform X2 [Silurus meridionalis]|uniref:Apoptosis antagonizing transcription factor n=1 Tax=Silurus meridionalis TaxID=175797 RepID=A0A8T0AA30_SILME|nr:protein AATF isoform X2 [Silurus meridionalis]KAF7688872.1 hypothetical protein HF521_013679 [Silurus meridionalis]